MSREPLVPVKFRQSWHGYSPGEVAGFTSRQADTLVRHNIAAYTKQDSSTAGRKKVGDNKQATAEGVDTYENK